MVAFPGKACYNRGAQTNTKGTAKREMFKTPFHYTVMVDVKRKRTAVIAPERFVS